MSHGAKMSARANYQTRLNLVIHNPSAWRWFDRFQWCALDQPRAAAPQKIIVEFNSADSVADWPPVIRKDFGPTQGTGPKSSDGLEHAARPIFLGKYLQLFEHRGSYPSAANFIAGEYAL